MKANWTIWNKLVTALASIVLLWAVAPRIECACLPLPVGLQKEAAHDCCRKLEKADATEIEHDCCKKTAQAESSCPRAKSTSAEFQEKSCVCLPERTALREGRKSGPTPDAVAGQEASVVYLTAHVIDQRSELRMAQLHNDLLKPSKIFLLNRAILD